MPSKSKRAASRPGAVEPAQTAQGRTTTGRTAGANSGDAQNSEAHPIRFRPRDHRRDGSERDSDREDGGHTLNRDHTAAVAECGGNAQGAHKGGARPRGGLRTASHVRLPWFRAQENRRPHSHYGSGPGCADRSSGVGVTPGSQPGIRMRLKMTNSDYFPSFPLSRESSNRGRLPHATNISPQ